MIATRGDAGAEEEHEEDQVPVRSPSPPSVLLASPQGGGLGWRLLSSIHAISGIGLPPPPGPKAGLSLLLHLKGDQQPHHHAEEPFDEASSSSAAALEVQCAGPEWPQPTVGAAAKGLSLAGDRCRLTDQGISVAWGPTHKNVLTLPHWLKQGVVDECAANSALQAGELGATQNDGALEEGAINKQGAAKEVITVVDQRTTDKSKATKDENTVEAKDKVMEQEGATEKQDITRDGNATKYQDEVVEQGVIDEKSAIKDQEKVLQQCTSDHLRATMDDQEVVEQGVIDQRDETTDDLAVEDQEKAVEQRATYELGTVENNDDVDDQEAVDRGVIDKGSATMDDNAVEDHEVVEQSAIDRMRTTTDDIAVEDQEKVVEQCAVDESRATKDEHTVGEKEKVVGQGVIDGMHTTMDEIALEDQEKVAEQCAVDESRATKDEYVVEEKEVLEQGVIDKQGAMPMDVTAKNQKEVEQGIIDNQGTMQMDDIAVKDRDKAVGPYASDAIIASKDENPVEEHKKVGDQGAIAENGRTKDDIDMEEKGYIKGHGIIDEWGRSNDCIALEDLKNEAELCIGDEQIAIKDVVAVHIQGNMLEQRISDEQGATKSKLTVEKDKEVVECVRHEWDATEDDLAMDTTASEGVSGISSSEVVSVTSNGSDGGIVKKEKVKLPVRYPQRPGKLNCPFYMSKGSCSYGFSCHFNHPRLKAKSDVWFPSEQGNHGVAEIPELNHIGLPIREGARSCTYYMRNGACRYGKKCHFNHPEQAIDAQFYPPTGWEDNALSSSPHLRKSSDHTTLHDTSYMKKSSDHTTLDATSYLKRSTDEGRTSYSKKSSDHATLDDTSSSSEVLPPNILRMLLPPQKVPPSREGKVMKVEKNSNWSSTSDDSDGCCSADSSDGPLCKQEHVDYPERPDRLECPFCTRFDDCKFASACKYHHSKDRYPTRYHTKDSSLGELIKYPERPGEPECPFYMKNRWCKFRAQCNFHHPKDLNPTTRRPTNAKKSVAANERHPATRITVKDDVPQQQQYPERPGQPDCRYYMQFGKCKYLSACIFHHPKDRLASGWHPSDPAQSGQYDTWQPTNISRLENLCQQAQIGTEIHGMPACPFYMKTRKCQFGSACEFRHLKDVCSTTEEVFGHGTDLAYDNFTRSENVVQQQEHALYPKRPGEPECSHYMRHGSCKFQMNCKYHHPSDRLSKKPEHTVHHANAINCKHRSVSTCYS